jgi:hypothetical protein
MGRKILGKVSLRIVLSLMICLAVDSSSFAGPRDRQGKLRVDQKALEFDSYEELAAWLTDRAMEYPESAGEILDALYELETEQEQKEAVSGCKNTTISPRSVVSEVPRFFKLYQIVATVSIGDCGLILCSTMGFDLVWDPGPSGGSILIGPFPSQTRQQICQGASISTRGFLILTGSVPTGSYTLMLKVGGFGWVASFPIPITIQ